LMNFTDHRLNRVEFVIFYFLFLCLLDLLWLANAGNLGFIKQKLFCYIMILILFETV